jgi:hypothetical protein
MGMLAVGHGALADGDGIRGAEGYASMTYNAVAGKCDNAVLLFSKYSVRTVFHTSLAHPALAFVNIDIVLIGNVI